MAVKSPIMSCHDDGALDVFIINIGKQVNIIKQHFTNKCIQSRDLNAYSICLIYAAQKKK